MAEREEEVAVERELLARAGGGRRRVGAEGPPASSAGHQTSKDILEIHSFKGRLYMAHITTSINSLFRPGTAGED